MTADRSNRSNADGTASTATVPPATSLYDLTLRAHQVVEHFLLTHGYHTTAEQFRQDARQAGLDLPAPSLDPSSDLHTLIESYNSSLQAAHQRRVRDALRATHASRSLVDPLSLTLPGPSTLPLQLAATHNTLHSANILSISVLPLPRRSFDTSASPPRFRNSAKRCLVTTAADKRIVFSDPATGEVEEILEADSTDAVGHKAAVLAVVQDPQNPRCLVSAGMDAKVIVWDLMTRKPVQVLSHHGKFVVKLAVSPTGEFVASAGYDRKVVIYRRKAAPPAQIATRTRSGPNDEDHEDQDANEDADDDDEDLPLGSEVYEKVHEVETKSNPEALLFVRAAVKPPSEEMEAIESQGGDEILVQDARMKRTWLAFTVRNDSFLHYVALPLSADQEQETDAVEEVASQLASAQIDASGDQDDNDSDGDSDNANGPVPDWRLQSFNTNPNPEDLHVSYSLLSLSLHPSGLYICAQTGDHTLPHMGGSHSSGSSGSLSRLLLLPLLSSRRAGTIWTGVPVSPYATPRHGWLPSGRACWLTSEDGVVRLVDMRGKLRGQLTCHGLVASGEGGVTVGGAESADRVVAWTRGGNTIVKDVVVVDENTVATCGFDKTVRVTRVEGAGL